MRISFEIFLLVAEELSISRASRRAFVTQQCVSDHIKRLEREYNVALFERKPKLHLTPAGRVMQENLRNIQIMEKSMNANLQSIASGEEGAFTMGISTSRASVILPDVLMEYYALYPKVKISFCVEDTHFLEEKLKSGEIDTFIGINTTPHPDFEISTLAIDEVMLIISSSLLHSNFTEQEIQLMYDGVDMTQFTDIPFTLSFTNGKVNSVIQEYLDYNNLRLNVIYNCSDSETQILLCATGICASLCPRMLLSTAYRHNMTSSEHDRLHMLPVRGLNRPLHVDLVTHKRLVQPAFMADFKKILQSKMQDLSQS